ncbi:MAG: alpha-glucosidase [Agathobacter sp.]|nr:alpha-glucosidase [Agathobacter sp.]
MYKKVFGTPFETYAITQTVPETDEVKYFSVKEEGNQITFTLPLENNDIVYGLGETMGGLNKRGGRYISFNTDTADHQDSNPSLYASHNFLIVDGSIHFGVFFDTPARVLFEIDYCNSGEIKVVCETDCVNVYQIEQENAYLITREFLSAIGRAYIPPLWAFGYGQSRFGYMNEADFEAVVQGHEENQLPLDYICMDIDYMDRFIDFTVDKKRFPDLKTFVAKLKEKGIQLVPIVDAGIKIEPGNAVYEEGVAKGYFCKNKEDGLFQAGVWPGMTHFTDFLNSDARAWFGNQYRFYTEQGLEGFWNDMNEPAIFYSEYTKGPKKLNMILDMLLGRFRKEEIEARRIRDYQSFFHQVNGKKVCHYDVHNIYGYFMTMAASEQLDKILDHRFLLFARSSYIGAGRYGGIWTGDNTSCWEHLKLNVLHMPSLNMCGFLYSGADTGGFMGNTNRELLLRWLAVSAFTPLMRNHCGKGVARQECYVFEKVEEFKDILSFRYRMIPYLYSEYMKAALTGDMFIKPLAFGFPEDDWARKVDDQLLVGGSIMMTPILEEGAMSRSVYLPEQMTMVKYDGKEFHTMPMSAGMHQIEARLNEVVFFVLKDKLVPIGKAVNNTSEVDLKDLQFLGDGQGYEMYIDDGMTKEYDLKNIVYIDFSAI